MLSGKPHLLMGFEPIRLPIVVPLVHLFGVWELPRGPVGACDADDCGWIGGWSEIGEELSGGEAGAGIDGVGSDFNEGDEDEGALGEARMRDFEAEFRKDEIAAEEEVEVDGAGAVGKAGGAVATEEALDGKERIEKDARGEI